MENYQQRQYIKQLRSGNSRGTCILGSGLVSHLATRVLKDSIILTKRRTDLFYNNIFFHDTIENRFMFSMFAIYYKSEKIPVYYYDATTSETTTTQTDAIRLQIAKEKMGNTNVPIVLSTMTNAKPDFTNLIFDENELTTGLLSSAEVVTLFPTSIKEFPDYVRLFFNDLYVDFDYLINTIPQPFFAPLVSSTETFKFNPLIFITSKVNEPNSMTYSYNNCFWKRKFVKQNSLCIEFNKEDFNEDQFKQEFPEITEYQKIEIPYGRISSSNVQDSKRIRHIGRFAQWDHSVTTEHSINKLINLNL